MRREVPCLRLLCLLLLGLALPARAEERFAVLIGANAGWANDRPLRYAEADAERMRDVLVQLGGFPADRVVLLRDPDTGSVQKQLAQLSETVKALGDAESLVVFYYSGHADEQYLHLRGKPLSHAWLYEALRDLPATVRVGVLDACRSGSILAAKGGRPARTFEVKVMDELRVRGLALLTSSGADELSQEATALKGSVFTHHLVSGLRGAADFDGNGAVTLSESYRHALQRTEADTAPTRAPHRPAFLYELTGQGEPVLTRPGQGAASLLLPPGDGERYVVVDEHESSLVAEGRTRPEGAVALALAPGTYHVTHVRADALAVATVRVEPGARVDVERLAYGSRPLSVGLLKGGPPPLEGEELFEWRRDEAVRLLDEGKPEPALKAFEALLAQRPEDGAARRGRVRALVRLAEVKARAGDSREERRLLLAALEAEPSLADDPDFARRYQRLHEDETARASAQEVREELEREVPDNPYLLRRVGLGVDVISSRGVLVISGLFVLKERFLLNGSFNVLGLGMDMGVRYIAPAPFSGAFSPTVGLGLQLTLQDLVSSPPWRSEPAEGFAYAIARSRLHVDTGVMVSFGGFFVDVGLAVSLYVYPPTGALGLYPMGNVGCGFLFL